MEQQFEKFVEFCERHLGGSNVKLLDLVKKRYDECDCEYKTSQEFFEYISCTEAKINLDKSRFFVYLRDFLNILKENKAQFVNGTKRSYESDSESVSAAKRRKIYDSQSSEYGSDQEIQESCEISESLADKVEGEDEIESGDEKSRPGEVDEYGNKVDDGWIENNEEPAEVTGSGIENNDVLEDESNVIDESVKDTFENDKEKNERTENNVEHFGEQGESDSKNVRDKAENDDVNLDKHTENNGETNESEEISDDNSDEPINSPEYNVFTKTSNKSDEDFESYTKKSKDIEDVKIEDIDDLTEKVTKPTDVVNMFSSSEEDDNEKDNKTLTDIKDIIKRNEKLKSDYEELKLPKVIEADDGDSDDESVLNTSRDSDVMVVEDDNDEVSEREKSKGSTGEKINSKTFGKDSKEFKLKNSESIKKSCVSDEHITKMTSDENEEESGSNYKSKLSNTQHNDYLIKNADDKTNLPERAKQNETSSDEDDPDYLKKAKRFRERFKKKYVKSVGKKKPQDNLPLKMTICINKSPPKSPVRKKPAYSSPKQKKNLSPKKSSPSKSPIIIMTDSESESDPNDLEDFKKKFDEKVRKQFKIDKNPSIFVEKCESIVDLSDSSVKASVSHNKHSERASPKREKTRVCFVTEELYTKKGDSDSKSHCRDKKFEDPEFERQREKHKNKHRDKHKESPEDRHKERHKDRHKDRHKGDEVASTSTHTDDAKKKGSARQIRKLESLLEKIRDRIEEVRAKELDIDDLDSEVSDYLLEDKLQRKFMKVWDKLCELHQATKTTDRPTDRTFKYEGTRYPQINKKIQRFINKTKEFPDYHDIRTIIKDVNRSKRLHLRSREIDDLSREAFTDVGNRLQRRRQKDFVNAFYSKNDDNPFSKYDDPALYDRDLKKKLDSNKKSAKSSMDKVVEKYAALQYQVGDKTDDDEEEEDDEDDEEQGATNSGIDDFDQIIGANNSDSDNNSRAGPGPRPSQFLKDSSPYLEIENLESGAKTKFTRNDLDLFSPSKLEVVQKKPDLSPKQAFTEQLGLCAKPSRKTSIEQCETVTILSDDDVVDNDDDKEGYNKETSAVNLKEDGVKKVKGIEDIKGFGEEKVQKCLEVSPIKEGECVLQKTPSVISVDSVDTDEKAENEIPEETNVTVITDDEDDEADSFDQSLGFKIVSTRHVSLDDINKIHSEGDDSFATGELNNSKKEEPNTSECVDTSKSDQQKSETLEKQGNQIVANLEKPKASKSPVQKIYDTICKEKHGNRVATDREKTKLSKSPIQQKSDVITEEEQEHQIGVNLEKTKLSDLPVQQIFDSLTQEEHGNKSVMDIENPKLSKSPVQNLEGTVELDSEEPDIMIIEDDVPKPTPSSKPIKIHPLTSSYSGKVLKSQMKSILTPRSNNCSSLIRPQNKVLLTPRSNNCSNEVRPQNKFSVTLRPNNCSTQGRLQEKFIVTPSSNNYQSTIRPQKSTVTSRTNNCSSQISKSVSTRNATLENKNSGKRPTFQYTQNSGNKLVREKGLKLASDKSKTFTWKTEVLSAYPVKQKSDIRLPHSKQGLNRSSKLPLKTLPCAMQKTQHRAISSSTKPFSKSVVTSTKSKLCEMSDVVIIDNEETKSSIKKVECGKKRSKCTSSSGANTDVICIDTVFENEPVVDENKMEHANGNEIGKKSGPSSTSEGLKSTDIGKDGDIGGKAGKHSGNNKSCLSIGGHTTGKGNEMLPSHKSVKIIKSTEIANTANNLLMTQELEDVHQSTGLSDSDNLDSSGTLESKDEEMQVDHVEDEIEKDLAGPIESMKSEILDYNAENTEQISDEQDVVSADSEMLDEDNLNDNEDGDGVEIFTAVKLDPSVLMAEESWIEKYNSDEEEEMDDAEIDDEIDDSKLEDEITSGMEGAEGPFRSIVDFDSDNFETQRNKELGDDEINSEINNEPGHILKSETELISEPECHLESESEIIDEAGHNAESESEPESHFKSEADILNSDVGTNCQTSDIDTKNFNEADLEPEQSDIKVKGIRECEEVVSTNTDEHGVSGGFEEEDKISSTSREPEHGISEKTKLPKIKNRSQQLKTKAVNTKPQLEHTPVKSKENVRVHHSGVKKFPQNHLSSDDENAARLIETYQEPDSTPYNLEENMISSSINENVIVLSDSE